MRSSKKMQRVLALCATLTSIMGASLLAVRVEAAPPTSRPLAHRCETYTAKSIDQVLRSAKLVALVRVKSAKPNSSRIWIGENVVYSLQVVEVFKGKQPGDTINLPGVRARWAFPFDPSLLDASYRHKEGFAKAKNVNEAMSVRKEFPIIGSEGYCEYVPYFEVGLEYVVILPEPYTEISFEPVFSAHDPWLARVRGYGDTNPLTGERAP